jgi:hypothetical protein
MGKGPGSAYYKWNKSVTQIFHIGQPSHGDDRKTTLKHLVFAYETFDKDYMDFNYFLSILSLITIYKTYYVSEQNNKMI